MDADFLLIQRMRRGEEEAVNAFVEKYYREILRYCRLHLRDRDYAQDAAQETFERFFRTLPSYQHYGKAANFLYVIAGNACKDHDRRDRELPLEQLPEEGREAELEAWLDVHTALDRLSPELRETAILYFCQERRQREIAKILGIGLPLVKYRVRRARELLLDYLKGGEVP